MTRRLDVLLVVIELASQILGKLKINSWIVFCNAIGNRLKNSIKAKKLASSLYRV